MNEIIFLKPHFVEKIWGGNKLKTVFDYNIPSDKTGECWAISGHKNGESIVDGGMYDKMKLSTLYNEHYKLFGLDKSGEEFPLLIKLLDAKDDLSVQVHPNNEYALKHNNEFGKEECWYILDCDENSDIIMGHNAKSNSEFIELIENNEWDKLLSTRKINKGEFFHITPGTVHAIKNGTLIYELQQSSDVTYRLYDYDRLQDGAPRDLHLDDSIAVITVPQVIEKKEGLKVNDNTTLLVEGEYFSLFKVENTNCNNYSFAKPYILVTVIDGSGELDGVNIKKGDHFIVPNGYNEFEICGNTTLMIASI